MNDGRANILFNIGKGESHHPKSGFKRLARRLRSHHSVGVLDDVINADSVGYVSNRRPCACGENGCCESPTSLTNPCTFPRSGQAARAWGH